MSPILKNILLLILGMVVAFSTISLIDYVGHQFYPPSEEIEAASLELSEMDGSDLEAYEAAKQKLIQTAKDYMGSAPMGALFMIMLSWLMGAFIGAFTSAAIADERRMNLGMTVGFLVLSATVANFIILPVHPIWMMISGAILIILQAWLGTTIAIRFFPKTPKS
ncbi:MAG: hypothetical protein AAFY71_23700 [Bacteroidota bacterium]